MVNRSLWENQGPDQEILEPNSKVTSAKNEGHFKRDFPKG